MHQFTNNSFCTLGAALSSGGTTFTAVGDGALLFAPTTAGRFQMATLEDPFMPGVYEIVKITARSAYDFTVVRGQEGTLPRSWAAGTRLSARVTAGMLQAFPQNQNVLAPRFADALTLSGYSVAAATQDDNGFLIPQIMSYPVVCMTHEAELGVVPTWTASTVYKHGQIVQPTTPNGRQYRLRISDPATTSLVSPGSEPAFGASAVDFGDGSGIGRWIPADVSATGGVMLCLPGSAANILLYIDEIGVICDERTVASSPYLTVGTADGGVVVNPTSVHNNQLTANGPGERQKFSNLPTNHVRGLVFRLSGAAATGGVYRCRFYFKGMFVEKLP